MKTYHQEQLALLICRQWDLLDSISECYITQNERDELLLELTLNVSQMSRIVDLYQNHLVSFKCGRKYYKMFSDLVKDSDFDVLKTHLVIKEVFALANTNIPHVIELGKPYRPVYDFTDADIECIRTKFII